LNKLYQDSGKWSKALEICENHDRIHLRNTYYNYAKVEICQVIRTFNTSVKVSEHDMLDTGTPTAASRYTYIEGTRGIVRIGSTV
jgi:hypothetical protein